MPFFRGYDPSELDEHGDPLPTGPGPAIFTLVLVLLIIAAVLVVKALA